jgi:hypothetical protein
VGTVYTDTDGWTRWSYSSVLLQCLRNREIQEKEGDGEVDDGSSHRQQMGSFTRRWGRKQLGSLCVDSLFTLIWLDTLDISSFYVHTSVADIGSKAVPAAGFSACGCAHSSVPPSWLLLPWIAIRNSPIWTIFPLPYSKVRMISSQYRGVTCFALASEVSCNTMSLLIFCPSKITTA